MRITICDLCEKQTAYKELRKRFIGWWSCNWGDAQYEKLWICDKCLDKIKELRTKEPSECPNCHHKLGVKE